MIKRYLIVTSLFICMISLHLYARRYHYRSCAGVRSSSPGISLRYTVSHPPLYAPCRDRWDRYRPYRSYEWYGPPYSNTYSVIYDASGRSEYSDRDDEEYYESQQKKIINKVYINEKEYAGVPFVCVELPSVDPSLYNINGRSYASLYALYAALCLKKYDVTQETRTVALLQQSKERFYVQARSLGVMNVRAFKDFTQEAFRLIKRMRKESPLLKKGRGSITFCTETDLQYIVDSLNDPVLVGYDSFLASIDSVDSFLENQIPLLKEKECKFFSLPLRRNSKEWIAMKVEKKGDIVYGVMIKVY